MIRTLQTWGIPNLREYAEQRGFRLVGEYVDPRQWQS